MQWIILRAYIFAHANATRTLVNGTKDPESMVAHLGFYTGHYTKSLFPKGIKDRDTRCLLLTGRKAISY